MTPSKNDTQEIEFCQEFQTMLHEKVRLAVRYTLITVLEEEVEAFIGAGRYERSDQRRDQRNGTYPRSLGTSVGQIQDLPVPRTRRVSNPGVRPLSASSGRAGPGHRRDVRERG